MEEDKHLRLVIAQLISENRGDLFIKHIAKHIKDLNINDADLGKEVGCKICNKTVSQIVEDRVQEIWEDIKKYKEAEAQTSPSVTSKKEGL